MTTEALFIFECFAAFPTSQNFTFTLHNYLYTFLSAIKQITSVNKLNFQVSNEKFLLKIWHHILSKMSVENFFLKKLFIASKKIVKSLLVVSTLSLIFLLKHTDIRKVAVWLKITHRHSKYSGFAKNSTQAF